MRFRGSRQTKNARLGRQTARRFIEWTAYQMEFVQKNVCEPDIDEVKAALASVIKSKEAKNKDRVNSITLENRSSFDDGLQICTEDVADDEI